MKSFIYIFIFCLFVVSCDFIVPNRLLVKVNGEDFTKIPVKKGEAFAGSYWKGGNVHYRLQIGFFLRGKKFSVQPLPLGLIPSSSSITVVPDSNNGIFESKNYDISKTIFTKIIRAEQFFDITYTSLINNDTVSFKIPPSDLLLLDGEPILKDTITIAFPKLNNFE
ncbi:MAG: hypothetical protein K6G32_07335 [Prevotella sp.]|nr:hypothetical protein [Prevotella sp.]